MSATRSRAISAALVGILAFALLWGVFAFTPASAQDTPATPPTANDDMMAEETCPMLRGAAMMTDTVGFGAHRHQGGYGQMMAGNGAEGDCLQARAGMMHGARMVGAMSGHHMQAGGMAAARGFGEGQHCAGLRADGALCPECQ